MSKRGSAAQEGPGLQAAPPSSPLREAAAAATREPLPKPQVNTSRGALEGATQWLPGFMRPAGMLLVGLARAAWAVAVPAAHLGYRLLVWSSPVLIWAFWKYINWYIMGMVAKAQRVLKWGIWVLSWFTKTAPPPA